MTQFTPRLAPWLVATLLLVAAVCQAQTPIFTPADLDNVRNDLTADYVLMNDIDMGSFGNFDPIGGAGGDAYQGFFNGQGFTISNLTIVSDYDFVGLFSAVSFGAITDLTLENVSVLANGDPTAVGALAGRSFGLLNIIQVSGTVTLDRTLASVQIANVGGIVGGLADPGAIENSISSATVHSNDSSLRMGGIAGAALSSTLISNCLFTGSITGSSTQSYIGGIAGRASSAEIARCFSTASLTFGSDCIAGGIVGFAESNSAIIDTGFNGTFNSPSGSTLGGVVGLLFSGTIGTSYARFTNLGGASALGGVVATIGSGSVSNSYWGNASAFSSAGGTSLTTSEMLGSNASTNMTGFNFSIFWANVVDGTPINGVTPSANSFPVLRSVPILPQLAALGAAPPPASYTLTYNAGTGGSITGTTPQVVAEGGDGAAVTATPSGGFVFVRWSDGSTANPRTDLNVEGDITVTAEFAITVTTWQELHEMRNNMSGHYVLMNDLGPSDAGYATYAGATANGGLGWEPVGASANNFSGSLDGNGFTISGLTIDRFASEGVGLFGQTSGAELLKVVLSDVDITGSQGVAALAGVAGDGTVIRNSSASGTINGVGAFQLFFGGLVGQLFGGSTVSDSFSTVTLIAQDASRVGGLVGDLVANSVVERSFASGEIIGASDVGGLVGSLSFNSQIVDSYSTGNVTALFLGGTGGLVGLKNGGTILRSFATGTIGTPNSGGLVGENTGTITNSYYNNDTAGSGAGSPHGTALNTGQMTGANAATNMTGFDFTNVWSTVINGVDVDGEMPNSNGYPVLRGLPAIPQLIAVGGLVSTQYTLTYNAGTGGSITGTTPQVVTSGSDGATVTAEPSTGFRFVQWSDGNTNAARTDTNVTANVNVTAEFIQTFNLEYIAGTGGSISGQAEQTVDINESGTAVEAIPDSGFQFVQWSDGVIDNPRTDEFVNNDISVTAQFVGLVHTWQNLHDMRDNLSADYILMSDLGPGDADYDTYASATANSGQGWQPIGNFTGSFDGNGFVISGLTIDRPGVIRQAFFGSANDGARFENVALEDVSIAGGHRAAGLVGESNNLQISNTYVTGTITSTGNDSGGLVGVLAITSSMGSFIRESYTAVELTGNNVVASLIGAYSVSGGTDTFELVDCFATGVMRGNENTGGLIGILTGGELWMSNCYFAGLVLPVAPVATNVGYGGIIGQAFGTTINLSSVYWDVTLNENFPGFNDSSLSAMGNGSITATGLTTGEMTHPYGGGAFTGWDFDTIWSDITAMENGGYPFHRWQNRTFTVEYIANAGGSIDTSAEPATRQRIVGGRTTALAIPDPDFILVEWSDAVTDNPRHDIVMTNTILVASFTNDRILQYTAGANGSLDGPADQVVAFGGDGEEVLAIPNPNYTFIRWSDGRTDNPRVDLNITENISVTALFAGSVTTWEDLHNMRNDLAGGYILLNDLGPLDAGYDTYASASANSGQGWEPIGTEASRFTGEFDGNGFVIEGLTINRLPDDEIGFFGFVDAGAALSNIRMEEISILGNETVGGLVGNLRNSIISGSYVSGSVRGGVEGEFTGYDVGGLVGRTSVSALIISSGSSATVSGNGGIGGLVGWVSESTSIIESYFTGYLNDGGGSNIGSIAGMCLGIIERSYSASTKGATNSNSSGGIVGALFGSGVIVDSYSLSEFSGSAPATGGSFGWIDGTASVSRTFSAGTLIFASGIVAGFTGTNNSSTPVVSSYWNTELNSPPLESVGVGPDDGITGLTTAEMKYPASALAYVGWDFDTVWNDGSSMLNDGYPYLQWQTETYSVEYTAGPGGSLDTSDEPVSRQRIPGAGSTITAIPDSGFRFDQWSDGVTDNPRTDSNINANINVTAEFVQVFNVTYDVDPVAGGSISGDVSQVVDINGDATPVTAEAATGYTFTQWSDGNTNVTRTDTTVTSDLSFTAEFTLNVYTLTYAAGPNGSVDGDLDQNVPHGGSGTAVEAIPDTDFVFVKWSDDVTDNPRTDTNVTGPINVTAEFAQTVFQVVYTSDANGSITGQATQNVAEGNNSTAVTATPNPGYTFIQWSDGNTNATRSETNVTENLSFEAQFADLTAPVSSLDATTNTTRAGATVSLDYTVVELGSGLDEVELYVRAPGSGTFEPTGVTATALTGAFVYTGADGNGLYEFATAAVDNDANAEPAPTTADVAILWNLVENGAFTIEVTSADFTTTHPMTNDIDILITIEGAIPGGTITVSRTVGNNAPTGDYDANMLLDEYITITGDGLGSGWTATITWNFDPDNATGIAGVLDTVFKFLGSTLAETFPISGTNPIIITGVTSFSDWYAGDASSSVHDWMLLMD